MSRHSKKVPSYRLHKASGQAVVTLNGTDIYLGKHGLESSLRNYEKVIAHWLANNRRSPAASGPHARPGMDLADIHQLFYAYHGHAEAYYVKDGEQTGEVANIEFACRPLVDMFGPALVPDFRPTDLKTVRQKMIDNGLARKTINGRINRIRRMFKWGVENDMVPPDVFHALQAVAPLRRGRSGVREGHAVRPVPEQYIEDVMPFLSPTVQAMIRVQEFTGMRPGELLIMRTCDIDATGKVWVYKPESHKTDHLDHDRLIYIGEKAQQYLRPYLRTELTAHLFSPRLALEERCAPKPNHRRQPNLHRKTQRKVLTRYTPSSYRRAISYACDQAFPAPAPLCRLVDDDGKLESPKAWEQRLKKNNLVGELKKWQKEHRWHPHQLRHNAATYLRKQFGLEAARVVLGHRSAAVTEIYAEMDKMKAAEIMEKAG